jgi:hypothetical protein
MKQSILSNWNFMRFFRLALGIAIIVQAAFAKDWTMGILGAMFTAMPIFNVGCCGVGGCATPVKKQATTTKDITYEEVV